MRGEPAGAVTASGYVRGLVLALALTVAPFFLVMQHALEGATKTWVLVSMALVQVVVHLVYFLHINGSAEQRWNRVALGFAAVLAAIVVGGSVWIMQHLNHNMMPMSMDG